ncbi:Metallothionein-like protein [Vigna angularis]|uniref:Metallothionein-like protein n=1 Tax=Phaseolus angularis TaxID=3914 RepID=A0A8T0JST2_PHAAN|nr:Metallothionein-like protein [Vigna angularis]
MVDQKPPLFRVLAAAAKRRALRSNPKHPSTALKHHTEPLGRGFFSDRNMKQGYEYVIDTRVMLPRNTDRDGRNGNATDMKNVNPPKNNRMHVLANLEHLSFVMLAQNPAIARGKTHMEIRTYDMLNPLRIGSLDVLSKSEGSHDDSNSIENVADLSHHNGFFRQGRVVNVGAEAAAVVAATVAAELHGILCCNAEKSTTEILVLGVAPVIAQIDGVEMGVAAENSGCKCGSNCTCDPCNCPVEKFPRILHWLNINVGDNFIRCVMETGVVGDDVGASSKETSLCFMKTSPWWGP